MAATSNTFNIHEKKKGGKARSFPKKVWTDEEQENLLEDFQLLPIEEWSNIKKGDTIRYYSKKDGFRLGGTVMLSNIHIKDDTYIKLTSERSYGIQKALIWTIPFSSIEKIYIKPDMESEKFNHTLEGVVQRLNDNIRKLAEYSKILEQRIASLEQKVL